MADNSEKDLQQFQKRLKDLAERSYRQNVFTFTDFLGLAEQAVFWRMEPELRSYAPTLWGGREGADRAILRFGDPETLGYEADFPIVCVHVKPLNAKFADNLSHRDFLGALMNLGIERSTMGDISVGEKEAYLFCLESIADFICDQLHQVRHTSVTCEVVTEMKELAMEEPKKEIIQVVSPRADAVIAKVYNLSRDESLNLFRAQKVYVTGRLCENNSKLLKAGDVVNARGYGKFVFVAEKGETKKGKINVEVAVYR
ncbi:MAG: hypothetical protein K5678_11830 [Acetatifactor sp.]|nr:hypothetical protein [Acetatifactor sp.]